jgi:hypothetical protein
MQIELKEILPEDFAPSSRVWIYQSSRLFSMSEAFEIEGILNNFISEWATHGTPVKGYANLFYGQFIVFMADETGANVSGCSTDSSVRVIKTIEQHFKVDMFNRQNIAFYIKDKVQLLPLAHLSHALINGFINGDTLYFNNLASTKEALLSEWLIPAKHTWLGKRIEALQVQQK